MKVVTLLSGGLDSTVLLTALLRSGQEVEALCVYYGQRHSREVHAARDVVELINLGRRVLGEAPVAIEFLDLSGFGKLCVGSSQTDRTVAVPIGHYADETMKATVVPNRNMMLLSVAAARAVATGADAVAFAAHGGDHAIYPDCRQSFVDAFQAAVRVGNWGADNFKVLAPFLDMTKADIVRMGVECGAPMAMTWSCYEGGDKHCGVCGTCFERKEAFQLAEVADHTEYVR